MSNFLFRRCFLALLWAVAIPVGLFADADVPPPSLLFNSSDAKRIIEKARTDPWAGRLVDELIRRAEAWPADYLKEFNLENWSAPWERGGWGGHYICPEHGVRLIFSPTRHLCPVCQKEFAGWPYDHEIFRRQHPENSQSARDLGLAFQLTGKPEYAAKAKKILITYAEIYPSLSIGSHKDWPRPGSRSGGRVTSQTLNESDWILEMAFAYDLIRGTLSVSERALIEKDLLRSGSDVIARRARSLGNWTARHNMAHLAVGLVLRDPALIDLAVHSEFGLRDQLRRSVTAEGVWHEGSWGYHFYAFSAIFLAYEMASRAKIELPERERLRLALDAPLASMLPDSTLPNFNDSGFTPLSLGALSYEMGWRIFGDRRYLRVVRAGARGLEALLWGAETSGEGDVPELVSTVLPDSGFATLRAAGSDHTVAIKFGRHAGGHSHFDRLNFVSFAHGKMQAVDPGTQSYSFPTHKTWDRQTVAHNTLVVDESSQAESVGRLVEWKPGIDASALRLEDTTSYPGVRLERLLVHTAEYTLDVFTAEATDGNVRRFDWIYHNAGVASSPLLFQPYGGLPQKNGYQHLSDVQAVDTAHDWEMTFNQKDAGLRVYMLGTAGTTVVRGAGLGQDLSVPVPFVMARRQGVRVRYVTLLQPIGENPQLVSLRETVPGRLHVESAHGVDDVGVEGAEFSFTRSSASGSAHPSEKTFHRDLTERVPPR